jgi:hypothetical protein
MLIFYFNINNGRSSFSPDLKFLSAKQDAIGGEVRDDDLKLYLYVILPFIYGL